MRPLCLAALALFSFGCASAQVRNPLPDYSGVKNAAEAERSAIYDKLKVGDVVGDMAQIDGSWYSVRDLKQIYRENQAQAARHAVNGAFGRQIALTVAPPVTLGLATFFGFYVGLVDWASTGKTTYTYNGSSYDQKITYDDSKQAELWEGAAIGAGVGFLAAGLEYILLRHSVTAAISKSGNLFNKKLMKDLQLQVLPEPGGAKASLGKSF